MKNNNHIIQLAFSAVSLTVFLASSCSKENVDSTDKLATTDVHSIEVTIPVGRDTKASYASGERTTYQEGDKLYVETYFMPSGPDYVGVLDYVSSEGDMSTFTGLINLIDGDPYSGDNIINECDELNLWLLPKGYEEVGYISLTKDSSGNINGFFFDDTKAIFGGISGSALDKSKAVPQVAKEGYYDFYDGETPRVIKLSPQNTVLYYTLNDAGINTTFNVSVEGINSSGTSTATISAEVGSDESGKLCFAVGFPAPTSQTSYVMKIDGQQTIEYRGTPAAKQVVNITRKPAQSSEYVDNSLDGVFSVANGRTVKFSRGNLCAYLNEDGKVETWDLLYSQCYGVSYNSSQAQFTNSTIDLFGWSSYKTLYGINSSENGSDYSGDFIDWGAAASKDIGYGWRTLTQAEWSWLVGPKADPNPGTNCRTSSTIGDTPNARWVKATIEGFRGLIIFPDTFTWDGSKMGEAPTTCNQNVDYSSYSLSHENWVNLEKAGVVFLPTSGWRTRNVVYDRSTEGLYWSSTVVSKTNVNILLFRSNTFTPSASTLRPQGQAVRLVRDL